MNAMVLMIAVLCTLAIAYRFYSKFLAARVLGLDDTHVTPAYTLRDDQNYHPTNKWVLFGHHFAAISGAGPLIGPVLAAQFGYLPGLLWILIGVCLGGAVQDFVILALATRRQGKSLAQIAYQEVGKTAGTAATIGVLFVLVIALAGLGKVVVEALGGRDEPYPAGTTFVSPWGQHAQVEQAAKAAGTNPDFSKLPPLTTITAWPDDNIIRYSIPTGTIVRYPTGAETVVGSPFKLSTRPLSSPVPISLDAGAGSKTEGFEITVKPAVQARHIIAGSAWGTLTIFLTIPIALLVGFYMHRIRKGKVLEASILGGLLTLGAVYVGSLAADPDSTLFGTFNLTGSQIATAMAVYGFLAAVLPVWILLVPRDYISSFLKIGTVAVLVLGVIVAHPTLQAPALNYTFISGGPILGANHGIFPFVFITIMCGAISGFHSLVSSGTTPKMIQKESHARPIGYGAMLIEGLVAIVALIAASSLPNAQYYHMNTSWKDLPTYQRYIAAMAEHDKAGGPTLADREQQVHETLQGRTGGAVTLAIGMASIFDEAAKHILGATSKSVKSFEQIIPYWYHFAIMFEALFILTTIDAGTRIGRFLLQEIFGKASPTWGKPSFIPSALIATALIVGGWWYFLTSNSMAAIWPMFGIANQLLAVMALAIASVALHRMGKTRYLAVTLLPMVFVCITTFTAAVILLSERCQTVRSQTASHADIANAYLTGAAIVAILICTIVILFSSLRRLMSKPPLTPSNHPVTARV